MSNHARTVSAAVASALAMGMTTVSAQERPWDFEITPYIWGVVPDADITVRGREGKLDPDTSDFWDRVDFSGSLLGVGRFGKFVSWTQVDFVSTDSNELDEDDFPAGANVRYKTDTIFATQAFGYQFGDMREKRSLDLLLGLKYAKWEPELRISGVGEFDKNFDAFDPVLIARPSWRISDRWRFNPTFSIGGGGDSDLIYELQPQIQFQMTDVLALRFGYRQLHYEIDNDNKLNEFDGEFKGLILGMGGTFGGGGPVRVAESAPPEPPQQVAAVTPQPAPAAPPEPGDGDGDGIADNLDRCPSTAAGVTVDARGCGFNTTLAVNFATNSAELTPESSQELDRLVEVMKNTSHVAGYIEGYTDSTGSAEYNAQLSKKRAEAVADYLISHGISQDRVIPRGYGERNPVADNSTEEGRAQNRRVVLKRIDADK